ncbi:hypothetical protein LAZ67_15001702 [Cordylochernes scorpioides]|uniref:Transposase Tc1-like domain-containing protein n=1 Tax=Cordylochernes scorpioides TaxID=51811 RepID=A0ABY6LCH4_9ARAC|nr:hypothetical protein LAZ67_15001702 [Cordylochernes scorpioides]
MEKEKGLTLDEWTSIRSKRYLNINIHSRTKVWNLGLTQISGVFSSEQCKYVIGAKLLEFGIDFETDIECRCNQSDVSTCGSAYPSTSSGGPTSHLYRILQHVQDTLDHSISTRTISRRLVANGLHSCRPLRRLPLNPPNRRQGLEWCRARSTWMTEWHRVVFSDESLIVAVYACGVDVDKGPIRQQLWNAPPCDNVESWFGAQSRMIPGHLYFVFQGTMTAQRYVDDVLRPVILPYLQGVPNALYQQDNARPHTARISQQALQDVQMLPLATVLS